MRHTYRQTAIQRNQTYIQTNIHTDRLTYIQTDKEATYIHTYRRTDNTDKTYRQIYQDTYTYIHTYVQTNIHTDGQTNKHKAIQTDRQTYKQINIHTHRQAYKAI